MSDPFDGSTDDVTDEMEAGRGSTEGTWSPDWIVLSGCSARGFQLYQLLRLRLNRRRRDRKVWPGLATLAVMMKLGTSESVSPYVKELEKLGAIDVRRERMPRRNVYVIHTDPPAWYSGPMVLEDWDNNAANRLAVKRIRDAERAKREKTRSKTNTKPQVKAEPGKIRDQARAAKTVSSDPGKIRDQDLAKNPAQDPGFSGVEPLGVEVSTKGTVRTSSPPNPQPQPSSTAAEVKDPEQKTEISLEDEDQEWVMPRDWFPVLTAAEQLLFDECMAVRPDWSPRQLRQVLGSPPIRDRAEVNPELVRRAFLLGARCVGTGPGRPGTVTPKRLLHDACPHWRQAAAEIAAEASGTVPPQPSPDRPAVTTSAPQKAAPTPRPAPRRTMAAGVAKPETVRAGAAAAREAMAANRAAAEAAAEAAAARRKRSTPAPQAAAQLATAS